MVRRGIGLGTFSARYDPDKIAVLDHRRRGRDGHPAVAGRTAVTPASAAQDVMTALHDMLSPARGDGPRGSPCYNEVDPGGFTLLQALPGQLTRLLDVGDGLDRGRLGQRLGLVGVGADALDVVAAPVGEPLGGAASCPW